MAFSGRQSVVSPADDLQGSKGELPRWLMTFEEELDQRVLVALRDGKKFVGCLKTFDQFGNVALEDCRQLIVIEKIYAELHLGPMIIRGDNIVLFGEVGEGYPLPLEQVSLAKVLARQQELSMLSPPTHDIFDVDFA